MSSCLLTISTSFSRILRLDCRALLSVFAGKRQIVSLNLKTLSSCPSTIFLIPRKTVRLGDYDTNTVEDCFTDEDDETECTDPVQDIDVKSFVAHPGFKNTRAKKFNDIGIVQLNAAANFKHNSIKPVCLPFANELQTLPNKFVVIGWGRTEKSARSAVLQKASLPFYELRNCARKLSTKNRAIVLNDGQFCAGGEGS